MMNWNQNDTKYILKRLILYFIIAGIVFFAGHSCAKAATYTAEFQYKNLTFDQNSRTNGTPILGGTAFTNAGQGYAIFTGVLSSQSGTTAINSAWINVGPNSSNLVQLQCEIGNNVSYATNTETLQVYTFKCPGNLGSGVGIYSVAFHTMNNYSSNFYLSDRITYISNESDASSINNAAAQASANEIANIIQQGEYDRINADNNATRIVNSMNSASQAQITAINNQTQAISDQTDWFDQDYSSIIDTEFLDVFDDLFDNDDDVVRQFILIPLNFFVLIYNACSSNTCSPIVLGELYGTTLSIPCINWSSLLGTAVTNTIDIIFAGCLVFGMVRMIKKMINKIMTLSSTITDECGVEVFK